MGITSRLYYISAESEDVLHALEEKTKGIIRGAISSGPHLSQTIILKSLQSEDFAREKKEKFDIMAARARKTKQVLQQE